MLETALALAALVSISLYGREIYLKKKNSKNPQIDPEVSYKILDDAIKKSREVLGDAELGGSKMSSDVKFFSRKIEHEYEEKLKNVLNQSEKEQMELQMHSQKEFANMAQNYNNFLQTLAGQAQVQIAKSEDKINITVSDFEKFLKGLEERSEKSQFQSIEAAKQQVDKLFEDFETKLADFLLQSEQKMMLAVDLELRSARQLIDTYKVQQMTVVDENIVAMLEKTLSLVLARNLNLKDQMDFVYESLDKAKAEKFIV